MTSTSADRFVYIRRAEGFDIVFLGGGKKDDFFPAHVAHAESHEWAERVCAALEALDAAAEAVA